jgi:hypothetical protein
MTITAETLFFPLRQTSISDATLRLRVLVSSDMDGQASTSSGTMDQRRRDALKSYREVCPDHPPPNE